MCVVMMMMIIEMIMMQALPSMTAYLFYVRRDKRGISDIFQPFHPHLIKIPISTFGEYGDNIKQLRLINNISSRKTEGLELCTNIKNDFRLYDCGLRVLSKPRQQCIQVDGNDHIQVCKPKTALFNSEQIR